MNKIRRVVYAVLILMMVSALPGTAPAQAQSANAAPVFYGKIDDGLPQFVCGADAFASYYTLEQMQVSGVDVKYKFHLGIVPFLLDGVGKSYDIDEETRAKRLADGTWDCLLTTLDSTALNGAGPITAVIDESAGADQIWGTASIKTLNDMKGKRVAYVTDSVSQFMALYAFAVAGLRPGRDVTPVETDSVEAAVQAFKDGKADVVSGWQPDILKAQEAGGKQIIASDKLRVPIDVIMTSPRAIAAKNDLVQAFHNAWFETLRDQIDSFDQAAAAIVKWGHNDWSGISSAQDLKDSLTTLAQATLAQNAAIMSAPAALIERLDAARRVWALADKQYVTVKTSTLVEPKYVLAAAKDPSLTPRGAPVNATFLLGSHPKIDVGANGQTLAVLPCDRFDFLPDSSILTGES
ncbi:MAG TPA: ABC transporter substrate-binding protein, partial [Aggregatilineales bacterium]|nr:ABC transporter substrate-binding protein [Aggregatilineales bacterium]